MPFLILNEPGPFDVRTQILDTLEFNLHILIQSIGKDESIVNDVGVFAKFLVRDIIGHGFYSNRIGRIYNRGLVAALLQRFSEKYIDSQNKTKTSSLSPQNDALFWEELMEGITDAHTSLLRNDANVWICPKRFLFLSNSPDDDDEDTCSTKEYGRINSELSQTPQFTTCYDNLMHQCKMHTYAAKVFQLLVSTDASFHRDVQAYASSSFSSHELILNQLLSVFIMEPGGHYCHLKPPKEVECILEKAVGDIHSFHVLLQETLSSWVSLALSEPTLVKLNYGAILPKSNASKLVEGAVHFSTKDNSSSNRNKASILLKETKLLSKTQRVGPDPKTIAEAIANRAIPDRGNNVMTSLQQHQQQKQQQKQQQQQQKQQQQQQPQPQPQQEYQDSSEGGQPRSKRNKMPVDYYHHNEFVNLREKPDAHAKPHTPERHQRLMTKIFNNESVSSLTRSNKHKHFSFRIDEERDTEQNLGNNEGDHLIFNNSKTNASRGANESNQGKQAAAAADDDDSDTSCQEEQQQGHARQQKNQVNEQDTHLPTVHETREVALKRKMKEITLTFDDSEEQQQGHARQQKHLVNNEDTHLPAVQVSNNNNETRAFKRKMQETTMTFDDSEEQQQGSIQPPEDRKSYDDDMQNLLYPRKRRFFTLEEKKALLSGVKKFGIGRWSEIKVEYSEIFRYRTAVQLKDCYRTMLKTKESYLWDHVEK